MNCLRCLDLRRQRRLKLVNDGFDDRRSVVNRKHRVKCRFYLLRPFAPKAFSAACLRKLYKVYGLKLTSILGITQKYHLLPFDLAERIVLHDDDLQRKLVFHRRYEFAHKHRKSSVSDERHTLTFRKRDLRGDGIGKTGCHRGEGARKRKFLVALDLDTAGCPERVRTA